MEFWSNLTGEKKQMIVAYGTSLTQGGAWVGKMKEWFDTRFPEQTVIVNSGLSGKNSDEGVAQLKERVLDHRPDLVFIEFSYNDAHEKFHMPVERGAENLQAMLDRIKDQNPEVVIVLQIMNLAWDSPIGNGSASARPQLEEFNENYRRLAARNGLELLDHSINWRRLREQDIELFQTYLPDGSHPSEEASMAVTWPTIKSYLEKGVTRT